MPSAIENFFAAWGMTDDGARANVIQDCVPTKFYYVDPRTDTPISDLPALVSYVAMYTQYAPGATATVVAQSTTKSHVRATVEFGMPDGKTQLGQYFIDCDSDGRLCNMVGFVGLGEPA
ncbi:hypothetical protein FAP39_00895 [Shimia litoralis]|uniref:Nuclear transport factor 2 family protein n=1 Tax=Shimia litoralis TaxID=420403 RepID=A0A4V6F2D7_9RHOB|nr:hypothetical protein [Shimia litoralis]TKZ22461.1 hypothetical protein FAP39_00895 [Shimia litoralis]